MENQKKIKNLQLLLQKNWDCISILYTEISQDYQKLFNGQYNASLRCRKALSEMHIYIKDTRKIILDIRKLKKIIKKEDKMPGALWSMRGKQHLNFQEQSQEQSQEKNDNIMQNLNAQASVDSFLEAESNALEEQASEKTKQRNRKAKK